MTPVGGSVTSGGSVAFGIQNTLSGQSFDLQANSAQYSVNRHRFGEQVSLHIALFMKIVQYLGHLQSRSHGIGGRLGEGFVRKVCVILDAGKWWKFTLKKPEDTG
jgi:hypothetical protein